MTTDRGAASWRCRKGWHTWFFESMDDLRMIDGAFYSTWVCKLVERCGRCGIKRTSHSAVVPRKVRVGMQGSWK